MDSTAVANIPQSQSIRSGYSYPSQMSQLSHSGEFNHVDQQRKRQYLERVDQVNVSKSDLNRLVMDYLVTAGYPSAAANLAHEAEINVGSIESWSFPGAVDTVRARADIRNALLMGQVGKAISIINDVDSMLLDKCPSLHFALLQLQLIELIRPLSCPTADIVPALNFATQNLAPLAPTNPKFMVQLEQTMCLLVFPRDKLSSDLLKLLDLSLRATVARRVNRALLLSPSLDDDVDENDNFNGADGGYDSWRQFCKLTSLIKLRHAVEQELRKGHPSGRDTQGSPFVSPSLSANGDGPFVHGSGSASGNTRQSTNVGLNVNNGIPPRQNSITVSVTGNSTTPRTDHLPDDRIIPRADELGYWPESIGSSYLEGRGVTAESLDGLLGELINEDIGNNVTGNPGDADGHQGTFEIMPTTTAFSNAQGHETGSSQQQHSQHPVPSPGVQIHVRDVGVSPVPQESRTTEAQDMERDMYLQHPEPAPGMDLDPDYVPLLRHL